MIVRENINEDVKHLPGRTSEEIKKFQKKTFTREEIIELLEDIYVLTAEEHNDYGKLASEFLDKAKIKIEKYMMYI